MARAVLSLESLKTLDLGKAEAAFSAELMNVVRDLADRPGDKTARTVTLHVIISPVIGQDGDLETAKVCFEVGSKLPKRKTKSYEMLPQRNGQLIFSEHSPEDVRQQTFADAQEKECETNDRRGD